MLMTEREYWFWLTNIEGIGSVTIQYLLAQFGTPEELWKAGKEAILRLEGLTGGQKKALLAGRESSQIRKKYEEMERKEISFVTYAEKAYPARLKKLYDPPMALFYKGSLPDSARLAVAVVGARGCSPYGREAALEFAGALSAAGVDIISGLARGIDAYGHRGALSAGGNTYGVLGCGPDICYPRENLELFLQIKERGGILSEFPPGTAPCARHFPMRNRIISGLSQGILVVEAREKSGSLITADLGLEQGKEIFVIPGRIRDSLSRGCNRLIQNGAHLVQNPMDVLESLCMWGQQILPGISAEEQKTTDAKKLKKEFCSHNSLTLGPKKKINLVLDSIEEMVYACLDLVPKNTQYIVSETGLLPQKVIEVLAGLEWKGCIREVSKNYYVRAGLWE